LANRVRKSQNGSSTPFLRSETAGKTSFQSRNFLRQSQNRQFLGFSLHFNRNRQMPPVIRKISPMDIIVMPTRIPAFPAVARRRQMKQRFPIPGCQRRHRSFALRHTVRQTAVVVNIVNQRNPGRPADRQQVGRSKNPVVVFQRQSLPERGRQVSDRVLQASQRRRLVAIAPSPVEIDHIGADQFRQLVLSSQFSKRSQRHFRPGRIQQNKLIGMKR